MRRKTNIQIWVACFLVIIGVGLLIAGFIVPPTGVIDSSALIAFGEISTFAGALFGIDYKYRKLN